MPQHNGRSRYTFDQFTAIRRYQPALAFSPDGREVAYSVNTSGQYNLWRQSSAGGYPYQLTTYTEQAVREIAWSPDGSTILFTADHHGDEYYQLYLIPTRGGLPDHIPAEPDVQQYLAVRDAWSPDGRFIAYGANDRERTDQDLLVRDARSGETQRPLTGSLFYPVAWSPDGKRLTVIEVKSNTDYDVHLVAVEDGSSRHLTPHEGEVKYIPGPWAADGSGFYFLTDEGREFVGLAFFDVAAGTYEWLETPDWDIEQVAASADGRFLAWVVNEDGFSRLHVRNLVTDEPVSLPDVPNGVISLLSISPDGGRLGMMISRPTHPAEIYVVDVEAGSIVQLTHSFLGGIDEKDLIEPDLVRCPTFDGREIPALFYRPAGAGRLPVVLSIHGGPEAQERPTYAYSGLYQYLVSRGIGVLAPNIRGSSGYGKSYQKLIHRDFGGDDLKDLEAAAVYLQGLDWVDAKRIGVFGGSYGGFATLSCVSRLPDYWAAAVDIVGPSNLVTFAKAVPPTWRRLMAKWVGDPEEDAEFLMRRSPISYVDQIKAPLFVIQGAKDPRVVQAESDQIVERLRERGVQVRYDVYDDEGHGFTKRENELRAWRDTAAFFEQHLLPE